MSALSASFSWVKPLAARMRLMFRPTTVWGLRIFATHGVWPKWKKLWAVVYAAFLVASFRRVLHRELALSSHEIHR